MEWFLWEGLSVLLKCALWSMGARVFTRHELSQQRLERDRVVQYDEHVDVESYHTHCRVGPIVAYVRCSRRGDSSAAHLTDASGLVYP